MQNKNKKNKRVRKGFSFGEVLISAFVLTVGLTATSALVSSSLGYSYDNRDAVVATQLAQEGVELVRNIRDENFAIQKDCIEDGAEPCPGGDGFDGFDESQKNCRFDIDGSFQCYASQGGPSSQRYYLTTPVNPVYGDRFEHTGTPDRFVRYTYVEYNDANKTAKVVAYVFWDWSNSNSMPSFVPSNGNTSNCTLANKCVFSEVFLTKWGLL
jgi:hypothetical protein